MSEPFDIAVIGGGAAGTMAALRSVLNFRRTLFFTGDLDARRRSRAQWVSVIDNMPDLFGRAHPITNTTVDTLRWIEGQEALAPRLSVVKQSVQALEPTDDGFTLSWTLRHRRDPVGVPGSATARYVVLATGIMDVQPHIQGSIEPIFSFANANQVLYCPRCDGHRVIGRQTAVIGHTDHAVGVAVQLVERYAPPAMRLLTHGQPLQVSDQNRALIDLYGIDVIEGTIESIQGTARKEGLQGFVIDGVTVPAERAFVALGTLVYNDLAVKIGASIDAGGYVLTGPAGESSVPGLYVVGDLQAGRMKQVYTAWDSAVSAVDDIDRRLRWTERQARLERAGGSQGRLNGR